MDNLLGGTGAVNRIYGVVSAIVTDNKDPEGLYRVKVKFPWVRESDSQYTNAADEEDFPSNWARIATFMAGKERGAFFLPEVDDEVLVAFEHGDVRRPIVIGSLWNSVDTVIHDNLGQDGKNDFRLISSRSGNLLWFGDKEGESRIVMQTGWKLGDEPPTGHWITIDAKDGSEKIEISDKDAKNSILIDIANKHIKVTSAEGDITLEAPKGTFTIKCKKLEVESTDTTNIKAAKAMTIKTDKTLNMESTDPMTIKGKKVNIN